MNDRTVTVFGGTGFLGSRVVRRLRKQGVSVQIASRHPDRGRRLFGVGDPQLQSIAADIHDEQSVVEFARHSDSSGTDADRQRVLAGEARLWTAWNCAALGRGDTPADVTEWLIQELPQIEEHDWRYAMDRLNCG